jgi:hypothetical protein
MGSTRRTLLTYLDLRPDSLLGNTASKLCGGWREIRTRKKSWEASNQSLSLALLYLHRTEFIDIIPFRKRLSRKHLHFL